jgi:outer membrane lipoprotein carrier protein
MRPFIGAGYPGSWTRQHRRSAPWLRTGLVLMGAMLGGMLLPFGGATALTAEGVADKVQAVYRGFSDLQASFAQRATNRLSGLSQEGAGRLFLKWPGKMRWEYERPETRLFLIDGKTLWSYSPTDRQAVAHEIRGAVNDSPIGILFGVGSLRRDFHIRAILHAGVKEGQEYLLDLTPKAQDAAFKRVILAVDRESFLIHRLTVIDLYGNTTVVEFSDLQVNAGLKDGLFHFAPPPGTEVIAPHRPFGL